MRACNESMMPVPVVSDLASWAQNQKSPADWMVGQLNETWQVPPDLAKVWGERRQVFPLLDGLDEVRKDAEINGNDGDRRGRG